jgi:hypothetical protein
VCSYPEPASQSEGEFTMSTDSHGSGGSLGPVTALRGVAQGTPDAAPDAAPSADQGTAEGRYLSGPGKAASRHVSDLQGRRAGAAVKAGQSQNGVERAENADRELKEGHRGGDRSWLLRLLIPVAVLAEAVTAYVAMESLVTRQSLAIGLAVLAALIGAGMACALANRRLNRLPVPAAARVLEGVFVAVLTVLRYTSLHILGVGLLTAAGGAALAALISALGLLGVEEIVAETRTSGMFLSSLRVPWKRWRHAAATARLAKIQAMIEAAAENLQQHYLHFLLKTEGVPLAEAQEYAADLKAALTPEA